MSSSLPALSGRRLGLPLLSAILLFWALPAFTEPAPGDPAAAPVAGPEVRFETALPGFKVARILWREGKLVLEHEGELVVLRQGDALPGNALIRLIEIGERGAVLREAGVTIRAAGATAPAPLMPERLIRLAPMAASGGLDGQGYSVTVLSAAEPPGPVPQRDAPLAARQMTGGGAPADKNSHQAPAAPVSRTGGGGGQ